MLTNRFKELSLQKANDVEPRVLNTNRLTKDQFGKLQGFKELPLEVFFEIGVLLEPNDLLALSRVSKFYRSLFLSRKSRSIWTRVLKNAVLPECPPFMNEPQYASLVYDTFCFVSALDISSISRNSRFARPATASVLQGPGFPFTYDFAPLVKRKSRSLRLWGLSHSDEIYSLLPSGLKDGYRMWDNSLDNRTFDPYLVAEMDLVMNKCDELCHDEKALKKYMQDRQVMSTIIGQLGLDLFQWQRNIYKRSIEEY
ncbi:hypothetical protein DXG01_006513 [Tephrocybe rancida]|nr:hypothetical protein DXG01_006513 [Tephrocybe rancida]